MSNMSNMSNASQSASLGFPRIGSNRELKKAVESYWKGNISQNELESAANKIKNHNWKLQKDNNIDYIPSNDFSFYDQILDNICLFGSIPSRYNFTDKKVDLDTYFSMARGCQQGGVDVSAMEMTKWFDTNYHYIVPEFYENQQFSIKSSKIFDEYQEAKDLGVETRPVLVGPTTFLTLGKFKSKNSGNKYDLLPNLLKIYQEVISKLSDLGVKDLQLDEPILVTDLTDQQKNIYQKAIAEISTSCKNVNIKLHLATYFAPLDDNSDIYFNSGASSYHVDLVRSYEQLDDCLDLLPSNASLSLGLVNGRNIWINNLEKSSEIISKVTKKIGNDRIIIAPSCSLLHSPVDLTNETNLDEETKSWMSFATQKLSEISFLKDLSNGKKNKNSEFFTNNQKAIANRSTSLRVNNQSVQQRVKNIKDSDYNRSDNYDIRSKIQRKLLNLPLYPTTTIGSFPQTTEIRKNRALFKKNQISPQEYQSFLEQETINCLKKQEDLGLDVLVHGEYERNDMVEYFGEQLDGFAFTKNGWVQSYGSRCVKPPIIFGDVSRPNPMTVDWIKFANNNTSKEVKAMLTGPVTILQWSFVRDDQPVEDTCKQIALAIRDEVQDLESADIKIIQIDEAAFREGLPIRRSGWNNYLKWAVDSFKLTSSVVKSKTQIHTHMCYSEFNDIIEAISNMDADVISIETSRSQMELLDAFVDFKYPNDIGPGVYDIHSPRVPTKSEIKQLLEKATDLIPDEKIWVNPDCGLKTRGWPEVNQALKAMVEATVELRDIKVKKCK
jgi:5-methyltetrahydropteroyltriglutamate--homocysteine methyltransferase